MANKPDESSILSDKLAEKVSSFKLTNESGGDFSEKRKNMTEKLLHVAHKKIKNVFEHDSEMLQARETLNKKKLSGYKLITSNQNKLKEFIRFGIPDLKIEPGKDLREVNGTDVEVVLYKALEAGKNTIVEDASLTVDGYDIGINIRWFMDKLKDTLKGVERYPESRWKVLLGVNDGDNITVYEGVISGVLKPIDEVPRDAFGFDPYFFPFGQNKSLYQLEKDGLKDLYSARKIAINNLSSGNHVFSKDIGDIKKWTGGYQH